MNHIPGRGTSSFQKSESTEEKPFSQQRRPAS